MFQFMDYALEKVTLLILQQSSPRQTFTRTSGYRGTNTAEPSPCRFWRAQHNQFLTLLNKENGSRSN